MEDEIRIAIAITISIDEASALITLADKQRRDIEDQAAILIHQGLVQYGLINWSPLITVPADLEES